MNQPLVVDDDRVVEVYADTLGQVLVDDGVCKITFLVRRLPEDGKPADERRFVHKICCRLVLTPQVTMKTAQELTKLAARALKSGPAKLPG